MKKFLALVLALVMTMSLVTISAGAEDFTDADSMNYAEAVEVMSAAGVVGGYADGSFNPQAGLTRGAAAKIICNMILGPTTAEALSADAAPYSDVAVDNVFAGYIAYCAKEGIISGYADGTFRPAAPLTGYAFMKMLLGALGYDATIEGYVGSNWSINVAKRALNIGLDDGLVSDFVGAKALTREEACLYAFNTMKATMVQYDNNTSISVGDIEITTSTKAEDVDADATNNKIWTGDETTQFAEKYFSKLKFENGMDAFGRPAITWWYGVKNDDNKVGQFVNKTPIATFEGITSEKEVYAAVAGDGASETIAQIYEDGAEKAGYAYTKAVKDNAPYFGNGVKVEIYDVTPDGATDPVYRLVAIRDYLATVTSINKADEDTDTKRSVNITLATVPSGFETSKVCAAYETELFAKKDVLVVNVSTMSGEIVVKAAQVAEKVEDVAVTSYKKGGMDVAYVTIDGVKTAYSQNAVVNSATQTYDMTSGSTHTFWLDTYGNVLDTEGYEAVNNDYVRVIGKSTSKTDDFGENTYYVYKVVNNEGKVSSVKMLTETGSVNNPAWATIAEDSENEGYYELKGLPGYNALDPETAGVVAGSAITSFSKNAASVGGIAVNNSTLFMLKTDTDKYSVVTGLKNMDSYNSISTTPVAVVEEGIAVVVYMDVSAGTASTTADDLVYILSAKADESYDTVNKCDVYTYPAIVNGEVDVIATKDASVSVGLNKITKMSDGYVADNGMTLIADADDKYTVKTVSAKEATFDEGVLTIAATGAYVIADDVNVTVIDARDNVTFDAGIDAVTGDSVTGTYFMVEKAADNGTVVAIYFDGTIA